mmetsp:Transcript_86472/g.126534  ORF Transcript_86472/g.126534 Transcript_86472/m.126534 type:complete len:111 (+) Transcript_86472:201-533(+)
MGYGLDWMVRECVLKTRKYVQVMSSDVKMQVTDIMLQVLSCHVMMQVMSCHHTSQCLNNNDTSQYLNGLARNNRVFCRGKAYRDSSRYICTKTLARKEPNHDAPEWPCHA